MKIKMLICPPENCSQCKRLYMYRIENRKKFPNYHNNPVISFGSLDAEILIVGLAPGLHGANQTNRPFTNDYAGDILYPTLKKYGFAQGKYLKIKDDSYKLCNVRVTNAVRCVPPQNKVNAEEITNCNRFLINEISSMNNLKLILCLGSVSHGSVLKALGYSKAMYKFKHGVTYLLPEYNLILIDSYHTSRYNINTNVLTQEMFDKIILKIKSLLKLNYNI